MSLEPVAATTRVCDANISNTETVSDLKLSLATPSKCNPVSVNNLKKKSSSKKSPNHCCICEVKHGSKLDNDYDLPWIGCSANKCETWLHLSRQFKTAITWKLPFPPADSQWAIFEKSTKIIQLHGLVTHVLHTHFT